MKRLIKLLEDEVAISNKSNGKSLLNQKVVMTLQTGFAQSFIDGTWKRRRMGLVQYDAVMRMIWFGAKEDDPYADWFLLKTYDAYLKAREEYQQIETNCINTLKSVQAFDVTVFSADVPKRYELMFKTPYGFMGATLLSDLDKLICHVVTIKRLGLANQFHNKDLNQSINILQTVFETPRAWRRLGVTREDVRLKTDKALKAIEYWGECPKAILNRTLQFAYWPKLNSKSVPQSEHIFDTPKPILTNESPYDSDSQ